MKKVMTYANELGNVKEIIKFPLTNDQREMIREAVKGEGFEDIEEAFEFGDWVKIEVEGKEQWIWSEEIMEVIE